MSWRIQPSSDLAWLYGIEHQQLHPELFAYYVHRNLLESSSSEVGEGCKSEGEPLKTWGMHLIDICCAGLGSFELFCGKNN